MERGSASRWLSLLLNIHSLLLGFFRDKREGDSELDCTSFFSKRVDGQRWTRELFGYIVDYVSGFISLACAVMRMMKVNGMAMDAVL
tara:strand:+ start:463 stop:723 length:261 start_codon:yes stop_codon:yes gene_type:complete